MVNEINRTSETFSAENKKLREQSFAELRNRSSHAIETDSI